MTDTQAFLSPLPFEWRVAAAPVAYLEAVEFMEKRAAAIETGQEGELFWLLEHPPLYTAGTSAGADELLDTARFPVYQTGRGGRYTYHGPGQRVVYVMCDLRRRDRDVRQHVARLEEWVIRALKEFGLVGERRTGRVGIWVNARGREEKIAAIGVRVRRWVTFHGLSLNVCPDLEHFNGIVPCGLSEFGVTSLHALGLKVSMADVDAVFRKQAEGLMF